MKLLSPILGAAYEKFNMLNVKLSWLIIFFGLISCNNANKQTDNSDKIIDTDIFFIEIVDNENSIFSRNVIGKLESKIYNKAFIATNESNDWQGVKAIDFSDEVFYEDLSESHKKIHRFIDISEYSAISDVVKIIINFNKPLGDTIPNFNYKSYKKLGHPDWQSVFNPGNFRFYETETYSEEDIADWMLHLIVLLSFK